MGDGVDQAGEEFWDWEFPSRTEGLGALIAPWCPDLPALLLVALSYPEPKVQPLLSAHQEAVGGE